ncbi:sensor histidine kinase [Actinomadura flavalba]|uniref:sensor histidine kinase n=1 Tax=Actinomadura flavalba TaxID=1120938 RepID=UPI0003812009|nr:sensor histidine kinase [Actinomadura flavalba]
MSTDTPTLWRAMGRNPVRFVFSSWPWRAFAYVVTGPVVALAWLAAVSVVLVVGLALTPVVVGLVVLACLPLTALPLAAVERNRLRWIDPRPAPSSHSAPERPGLQAWMRFRLREPMTWREFGYALLTAVLGVVDVVVPFTVIVGSTLQLAAPDLVRRGDQLAYGPGRTVDEPAEAWLAAGAGLLVLLAGLYLITALAGARAALARALLVRDAERELIEVRAARVRLADAFEAERRRIERDLHDGAQQRLTALIMTLGLARLDHPSPLLDRAHTEAKEALEELRDLVHGIHPPVLTDRGLGVAVEALAERSVIPVDVDIEVGRLPEAIESAAYFVVAEGLANVAKHSGASRARVTVRPGLVVEVQDDGSGGAEPGTGVRGLADRVAVHDGTVRLSSPAGGPTVLRVEIPCAS